MEKREKKNDSIFQHRLERHHDELRWLYMELYQNGDMFAELCSQMYEYYNCRSKKLKERDLKREKGPDWYHGKDMLGKAKQQAEMQCAVIADTADRNRTKVIDNVVKMILN